ncbi:hypothetical protein [Ruegeria jejuensis]|uniref:hypothetical protein n=1 Tax=Ruegeria jejuensis TaxID=3233338 RepID=UPI00355C2DF2
MVRKSVEVAYFGNPRSDAYLPDRDDLEVVMSRAPLNFDLTADLLADNELTYLLGTRNTVEAGEQIWADHALYEVAASGASDHHETTAGGIKLYESGYVFSNETRLLAAISRIGASYRDGTIISSPEARWTKASGVWTELYTVEDAIALIGAKLDDAVNAVAINRLQQMSARTFVGNPSGALATPTSMGLTQGLDMLGFTGVNNGAERSLGLPSDYTDAAVTEFRFGSLTTNASGTTNHVYTDPFPTQCRGVFCQSQGPIDTNVYEIQVANFQNATNFDVVVNQKNDTGSTRVARAISFWAWGD